MAKRYNQDNIERKNIFYVDSRETIGNHINLSRQSVENKSYLFEVLLRAVPVPDIYEAFNQSSISKKVKIQFKKEFLNFQLENLQKVVNWQKPLLINREKLNNREISTDEKSKELDTW
ncbi:MULTISPECIES: hypothetical protein [unclassified Legionella]|uniref:hypothetical protein n=1 Tax=unclassified Legionella TaxID=2622702 RepID=UPI0010558659|nr:MULTISPECIES: hypothetical protein [unclassified Legionella]MDI9819811.1 hypothetical protein [Legionella sp. PL877]